MSHAITRAALQTSGRLHSSTVTGSGHLHLCNSFAATFVFCECHLCGCDVLCLGTKDAHVIVLICVRIATLMFNATVVQNASAHSCIPNWQRSAKVESEAAKETIAELRIEKTKAVQEAHRTKKALDRFERDARTNKEQGGEHLDRVVQFPHDGDRGATLRDGRHSSRKMAVSRPLASVLGKGKRTSRIDDSKGSGSGSAEVSMPCSPGGQRIKNSTRLESDNHASTTRSSGDVDSVSSRQHQNTTAAQIGEGVT